LPTYPPIYTRLEIAQEVGVSVHTIRRWIQHGLLQKTSSRTPDGRTYTELHMRRARAIKRWVDSQVTRAEMAERAEVLGDKAFDTPDPYADLDFGSEFSL